MITGLARKTTIARKFAIWKNNTVASRSLFPRAFRSLHIKHNTSAFSATTNGTLGSEYSVNSIKLPSSVHRGRDMTVTTISEYSVWPSRVYLLSLQGQTTYNNGKA